jgi:hypothetical protein
MKPGRKCTCCEHKNRVDIDRAILRNETLREIAARFAIGAFAVQRHKAHVVRPKLSVALAVEPEPVARERELDLRAEVFYALDEAKRIGELAEEAGDHAVAMSKVRQVTAILELVTSKVRLEPQAGRLDGAALEARIAALRAKLLGAA